MQRSAEEHSAAREEGEQSSASSQEDLATRVVAGLRTSHVPMPTPCRANIPWVEMRDVLEKKLAAVSFVLPLEEVLDNLMEKLNEFRDTFGEIYLDDVLEGEGNRMSLCPYCATFLPIGEGSHFLVDRSGERGGPALAAFWVKDVRAIDLDPPAITLGEDIKNYITKLVEGAGSCDDFMEAWDAGISKTDFNSLKVSIHTSQ